MQSSLCSCVLSNVLRRHARQNFISKLLLKDRSHGVGNERSNQLRSNNRAVRDQRDEPVKLLRVLAVPALPTSQLSFASNHATANTEASGSTIPAVHPWIAYLAQKVILLNKAY